MEVVKILVVPCDTEIAYEIIDSLSGHKYFKLVFAAHDRNLRYLHKNVYFLPFENDENFFDELNNLVERESIKFIYPANDNLAYVLSTNVDKIRAKLITHNADAHRICRFKDKTYHYFYNKIPVPKIYELNDLKDSDFPVFVKPKKGQGSLNAHKINNFAELKTFFLYNRYEDYLICEYLPCEEFTVDCFAHNGKLLYYLVRRREKTFRGISVISTIVNDRELNEVCNKYAELIASSLNMHGIFFFQVKFNKDRILTLLEVGPRVPGTLSLNRALGVNLVELSVYQALGMINENSTILRNEIQDEITIFRTLDRHVRLKTHDFIDLFDNIYIDFDDTLVLNSKFLNLDVIKFIFLCKNNAKRIFLITKNDNGSVISVLKRFGIYEVFDEVIILKRDDKKINYMKSGKSLLIDDSFKEREEAINNGITAYSPENIKIFFED